MLPLSPHPLLLPFPLPSPPLLLLPLAHALPDPTHFPSALLPFFTAPQHPLDYHHLDHLDLENTTTISLLNATTNSGVMYRLDCSCDSDAGTWAGPFAYGDDDGVDAEARMETFLTVGLIETEREREVVSVSVSDSDVDVDVDELAEAVVDDTEDEDGYNTEPWVW
ncbi:hypothetical protein BZA05DRAFT_419131 [Tricharina praecox]|uniref:uncharacterized protein n=1 Tax=Tricharina praecox TaxID=43433 RepID=UPI002220211F|nr:uncharacterized protein BZA05DRAFT_419131 [Tricharina praecox]KAI5850606.1 hypothetical protein BZA05DRAFT_419131 [Tricharina praecox]